MPKVTEEYRAARRDEIIDAAVACVGRVGYARTSIADLVAESGLSAGAIYGNFPGGKQELFVAAASRILRSRTEELAARAAEGPLSPGEIMAVLIEGMRRQNVAPVLPQLWGEAAIDPEIRTLVGAVFLELRATIRAVITEWAQLHPERITGEPEVWAERVTPVVLSAAPGFVLQRAMLPDFDADAYIAALPEVLPH